MVKIIHTSDLHLSTDNPERLEALEEVLSLAEKRKADLVTIGGDLFDSEVDAENLRSELRDMFSDRSFEIIAIPGNHDSKAFRKNLFFGENFQAAVEEPYEEIVIDEEEVKIICLPYTPYPDEDLLVSLKEMGPFAGTKILLLHCSLEAPISDLAVGEEEEGKYFPISKDILKQLGFDYYLSGHYHHPPREEKLSSDSIFVYPGSPVSITQKEITPRNVVLLETEQDRLEFQTLETFHFDHLEIQLSPGGEDEALEKIEKWATERTKRNTKASIEVKGHIEMGENIFNESLKEASKTLSVSNQTKTVEQVLKHPLYQSFESKLKEREFDEEELRDDIRERVVRVFSDLFSGGRLS